MTFDELVCITKRMHPYLPPDKMIAWNKKVYESLLPFLYRDSENKVHVMDVRPVKEMLPTEFEIYYTTVIEIVYRMSISQAHNFLCTVVSKSHFLKKKEYFDGLYGRN